MSEVLTPFARPGTTAAPAAPSAPAAARAAPDAAPLASPDIPPAGDALARLIAIPVGARTREQWLQIAAGVSAELDATAMERARHDLSPREGLQRLKDSGLSIALIPREHGGGGGGWLLATQIVREIAAGDGSIGLLLAYHSHNTINLRREMPARRAELERQVAAQRLWLSGIANPSDADIVLSAAPDGDGYVLNGRKTYCTGAVFADRISISARRADTGQLVRVSLPADRPGLAYGGDWDNLGVRQAESGSFTLTDVRLAAHEISAFNTADTRDFALNIHIPVNQSAFSAAYLGFALGALRAARGYIQEHGRPWRLSTAERHAEDPHVLYRVGEFVAQYEAGVALAERGAALVEDLLATGPDHFTAEQRGRAIIGVYHGKIQATRASLDITAGIYEVMGARAAHARFAFDRFWRDARSHTLHDPVSYRLHEVGDHFLNGRYPPARTFA